MILDIFIVIFGIMAIFRGRDIGFVRQIFSTVGFFGGLFIGALLEPHTIVWGHTAATRGVITITTTLGSALLLLTVGEYLGSRLKHRLVSVKIVNSYDNAFGAVLGIASMLFSIWLTTAVLSTLPYPSVQTAIHKSAIIRLLDRSLPGAPNVIASLGHLVDPNGFPQVFLGSEPIPRGNISLPSLGDLQKAVNLDKDSVVKVAGQGCGGIVEGSGFIVEPGLIATNAHVVAGIRHPYVQDANGEHGGSVIWFDPNLDFAVVRVSNLAGKPLLISSKAAESGTPAAVVGYPGGGAFNASSAAVLDSFTASGRNIYGKGNTNREVYEIQADVIPGNSGGPLIDKTGTVIGVIFAESTSYKHVGYALTTPAVTSAIAQAVRHNQPVSTGKCAE
jgi:S1-C subfamily serine protease